MPQSSNDYGYTCNNLQSYSLRRLRADYIVINSMFFAGVTGLSSSQDQVFLVNALSCGRLSLPVAPVKLLLNGAIT